MKKFLFISISLSFSFILFSKIYAQDISVYQKFTILTQNKRYTLNNAIVNINSQNLNLGYSVRKINSNTEIVEKPNNMSYENFLISLLSNTNLYTVAPNYIKSFSQLPNNIDITQQKNLFLTHAPVVDNNGFSSSLGGSSNITIAVLDSGIAYQNYTNPLDNTFYAQAPSLSNLNIKDPYNALAVYNNQLQNEYAPYDNVGHGTYIAGIIASSTNNDASGSLNYATAGIAFNATIMPVKIGNSNGIPLGAELLGLQWAINNHANIINLSIASTTPSQSEETLIEQAINDGIIVVAASGNEGSNSLDYPAGYPNVIAVGASNSSNTLTSYSNYGCSTDLNCQTVVAPVGYNTPLVYQQTLTGYDTGTVSSFSSFSNEYLVGTSFATPQVVAAIALYESVNGVQNSAFMENILKMCSTSLGNYNLYGFGLLNINNMLNYPVNSTPYTVLSSQGTVSTFGQDQYWGNLPVNSTPTDIARTNTGYYILTSNGAVYTFGNAQFYGSMYNIPNPPVQQSVAIVPTKNDLGYYILTEDGAVYTFGNAQFYGSMYNIPSSAVPVRTPLSLVLTQDQSGYYILTSNGAVYTFGDAQFYGSVFNIPNAPVKTAVALRLSSQGEGYYILTKDGAIYTFGDAQFYGSMYNIPSSAVPQNNPTSLLITNSGYMILEKDGALYTFGGILSEGTLYPDPSGAIAITQ